MSTDQKYAPTAPAIQQPVLTPAEEQFHTSSSRPSPTGYERWQIRNDYPPPWNPKSNSFAPPSPIDAPWLLIPLTDAELYMAVVREYCFEGMTENFFVPQKNQIRQWYHAPWMHYGAAGREPLHGLTSERYTPARELSATQQRTTQTWAVGFFNSAGASTFGGMWKDPDNPSWKKDVHFPPGTAIFKLLFSNATDEELPILKGSPAWPAMIAQEPTTQGGQPDPNNRVKSPQNVRLLQMDISLRDDRSKTGWVYGTYMYNGLDGVQGYDGMIPVGLSWGNDPEVTQEVFDKGGRPKDVWFNPAADKVRISLHGGRPGWGWNGRLNGPADNFISACQSCHSTAQWNHAFQGPNVGMVPPAPVRNAYNQFVPNNDKVTMTWFDNIPCGTPLTKDGAVSADYSLQLMIGYENFKQWEALTGHKGPHKAIPPILKPVPTHRRQGPDMGF